MPKFDMGALGYVFLEEILRYFDIVESGIHTDKPTGEDYLEVVFEEKNTFLGLFNGGLNTIFNFNQNKRCLTNGTSSV